MAQVQCPNCGGFDVKVSRYDDGTAIWVVLGISLFTWGVPLILYVMFLIYEQLFDRKGVEASKERKKIAAEKNMAGLRRCTCNLCKYDWEWKEGTTYEVQVRPDLIAAGRERLKKEEEERRRRND